MNKTLVLSLMCGTALLIGAPSVVSAHSDAYLQQDDDFDLPMCDETQDPDEDECVAYDGDQDDEYDEEDDDGASDRSDTSDASSGTPRQGPARGFGPSVLDRGWRTPSEPQLPEGTGGAPPSRNDSSSWNGRDDSRSWIGLTGPGGPAQGGPPPTGWRPGQPPRPR